MKLYIKNMVCNRCLRTVKNELDKLGILYMGLELGEVTIKKKITAEQHTKLYAALQKSGFELMDDMKTVLIENLKKTIIDLENHSDEDLKTSYSDYISLCVDDNFISLNTLFAEIEGITIEKYIIRCKMELVKELLIFNDLNLSEIAHKMHYSNTTKLSGQFKSITGMTLSHFRQLHHKSYINPENN